MLLFLNMVVFVNCTAAEAIFYPFKVSRFEQEVLLIWATVSVKNTDFKSSVIVNDMISKRLVVM